MERKADAKASNSEIAGPSDYEIVWILFFPDPIASLYTGTRPSTPPDHQEQGIGSYKPGTRPLKHDVSCHGTFYPSSSLLSQRIHLPRRCAISTLAIHPFEGASRLIISVKSPPSPQGHAPLLIWHMTPTVGNSTLAAWLEPTVSTLFPACNPRTYILISLSPVFYIYPPS